MLGTPSILVALSGAAADIGRTVEAATDIGSTVEAAADIGNIVEADADIGSTAEAALESHVCMNMDACTATWTLPATKTDINTLGTTREWGRVCCTIPLRMPPFTTSQRSQHTQSI